MVNGPYHTALTNLNEVEVTLDKLNKGKAKLDELLQLGKMGKDHFRVGYNGDESFPQLVKREI